MTSAGIALMTCLFILAMQKTIFPYYIALSRTQECLHEDRQKELVLPSLIFVNIGCRMCYHFTWREWKMKPSQQFLRSLKLIKESSKRHESNHCNRMKATKILIQRSQMGEDIKKMKGEESLHDKVSEQLKYENWNTRMLMLNNF